MPEQTTLAQVLEAAPSSYQALTQPVKGALVDTWGQLPASDVGKKNMLDLTRELAAVLPDDQYNNDVRFGIARDLHRLLVDFGFASDIVIPQTIKVEFDKTPAEMTLRELLEALATNASKYAELKPFIERNEQVMNASRKTKGDWVIPGEAGGIDVELTLRYVTQLNKTFALRQREYSGRRPTSLDKAMGAEDRPLIHPFLGKPVQGPDENGFDFSQLDPELHEALIWAAVTQHAAFPRQPDPYTYSDEVFRIPLPRRWQTILADYRFAKANDDDSLRGVSRYWPKGVSYEQVLNLVSGQAMGASAGSRGENYYRQLVEQAASRGGTLTGVGSSNNYKGGVYEFVQITGSSNDIKNIIVTGGGRITGSANNVKLLLPPGVQVTVVGSSNDNKQTHLSWRELAEHAGLV